LPGKEIGLGSSTKDERLFLITASSDTEPGERYLFDRNTKKLTFQYRIREKLNRDYLASMTPCTTSRRTAWKSRLPDAAERRAREKFAGDHSSAWRTVGTRHLGLQQHRAVSRQPWLRCAYAEFPCVHWLRQKILDAGNNEWGQKMQDDVTWGTKYLISEGIADPKRIGIMGGSYGGYAPSPELHLLRIFTRPQLILLARRI
jgi:hypothetical protein